jgi:hypothetical protein
MKAHFGLDLYSENLFAPIHTGADSRGNNMAFETKSATGRAGGHRRPRTGLTILEFLACTIAVIGGAWLGALYLGVYVRHLAYSALSQAKLLDKMPVELRPVDPNEKVMTREQLLNTLHEELGSLRNQITSLRSGTTGQATVSSGVTETNPAHLMPTKEKTLAYWQRLNEIAIGESQLQRDAESAFNTDNAAKVFAIKGRISRFSAKAVESVPTQEVDEALLRYGRQLGLWYDRAGELYEKAVRIWETPIGQQARTQLNDEWKRADDQHVSEGRLLNEKAAAVRGSMSRIYGTEFPVFDKSSKPVASIESTGKSS